jgi:hypothetical protein
MKNFSKWEMKLRSETQSIVLGRWMSATGMSAQDYVSMWGAEAFHRAWEDWIRDKEVIYTIICSTQKRITTILEKQ